MLYGKVPNLHHTLKWNPSCPGPEPSPWRYNQPQDFYQTLSSTWSHLLYPFGIFPTCHPWQRDGWTWRSPCTISIIRKNLSILLQKWQHRNAWPSQNCLETDRPADPTSSYSYCPATSSPTSTSNHGPDHTQDGNPYLEWKPLWFLFMALLMLQVVRPIQL